MASIHNSKISLLKRIFIEEVWQYRRTLFIAVISMVIVAVTTSLSAYLIDPAIKKLLIEKDANELYTLPALIIFVSILRGAGTYLQAFFMGKLGMNVVHSLQKKMYKKILYLDFSYFSKNHSAQIVMNFINDAMTMRDAASTVIVGMVKETLTLIGCIAVMFYQDWFLTTISLFIFMPLVIIVKRLMKKTSRSAKHIAEQTASLSAYISETVRGMRILRVYNREEYELNRADSEFGLRLKFILKEMRAKAASSPLTEAMTGIGMAVAIFYAGSGGLFGKMDINNFMAFFASMMLAYQPARVLSGLLTKVQSGVVAAERVYRLLDEPILIQDNAKNLLENCNGNISFDDISFAYNNEIVLENVSLEIKAGEKIALVGPSGGGKSTLLNLIPRFYDIQRGKILIDALNVREISIPSLRENIALVSQDVFLFSGTIKENILYGKFDAGEFEIIEAAKNAAAYDFIMALPQKFDTHVGEAGMLLSGGQKQRIAIARAFLKNAPILLLDEATSALDNESEAHIQQALKKLMQGRTTITIAHRLSTVIDSDKIIVIDRGRVVGQGTHLELLNNNPLYAKLCKISETGENESLD